MDLVGKLLEQCHTWMLQRDAWTLHFVQEFMQVNKRHHKTRHFQFGSEGLSTSAYTIDPLTQ